MSDLIQKGTLGRIVEFESHFDRYEPQQPANAATWKHVVMPGHGAIYDVGVHLLDQSVRLFGLPDRVTGIIGTQREGSEIGFEDAFTVLLHYSGLLVTVKATVISPAAKQLRFWVRGERGSFKKVCSNACSLSPKTKGIVPPGYSGRSAPCRHETWRPGLCPGAP